MSLAIVRGNADGTFDEPVFHSANFVDGYVAHIDKSDGRVDFFVGHELGFGKFELSGLLPIRGDFDESGKIDAHDIDLLCSATRTEAMTEEQISLFDLNADQVLTSTDVETWVAEVANTKPGDTDADGDVDFADFLNLSTKFGVKDALWSDGDFNCDGEVTFADFLLLSANFGATS